MLKVLFISLYSIFVFSSENHIGDCNNQGSTAPNDELFEEEVVSEDIAKCYNYNQYDAYQYLYPQIDGHDSSLKRISQLDELTTSIDASSKSIGKPLSISRENAIRSVLYRDSFNVYQSTREFAAVEKISPCGCVPRNKLEEHLSEPFNEFNDIVVEEAKKKSKQIFKNRVKNAFQNLADLNNLFMLGKVDRKYLPEIAECSLDKMKSDFITNLEVVCPAIANDAKDIAREYFDDSSKPYFNQMTNGGRVSCLSDMEVDTLMAYSNPNIYFEPISPVYNETTYLTSIGSYESDSIKHFEYMGQYKNIITRMAYENETIKNIIDETIKKLQEEDPPKMLPDWFNKIDYGEDDGGINDLLLNNPQIIHEMVQNTRLSCKNLYRHKEVIKAAFCPANHEIPDTSYELTNRGAHGIANNKCQKRGRRIVPKKDSKEVKNFFNVRKFLAPLDADDSSYDSDAYSMFCYDKENLKTRTDMYEDLNNKIRGRLKKFYGPQMDSHTFYVAFSNNEICKNGEHRNENGLSDECKEYKKRVYDYLINNKEDSELEKVFLDSYFESSGLMVSDSGGKGVMNEEKMPLIEMVYLRDAIKKDITTKGDSVKQDTVMSKAFVKVFETSSNDDSKQQVFTEYAQNSTQEDVDNLVTYRETRTPSNRSEIPYTAKTTVDYTPVRRPVGDDRFRSPPALNDIPPRKVGDQNFDGNQDIDSDRISAPDSDDTRFAVNSGQDFRQNPNANQVDSNFQTFNPVNTAIERTDIPNRQNDLTRKVNDISEDSRELVEQERELRNQLREAEREYREIKDTAPPEQKTASSNRIEQLRNQLKALNQKERDLSGKKRDLQNQLIAKNIRDSFSSGGARGFSGNSLSDEEKNSLSNNDETKDLNTLDPTNITGANIDDEEEHEEEKGEGQNSSSIGSNKAKSNRSPASQSDARLGSGGSLTNAVSNGGDIGLNSDGDKVDVDGEPLYFDEFTFDRVIPHEVFIQLKDFILNEYGALGKEIYTLEEKEEGGNVIYIARHFILRPTIKVKEALGANKKDILKYSYVIDVIKGYLKEPDKYESQIEILSNGYVLKEEKIISEDEAHRFKLSLITLEELRKLAVKVVEDQFVEIVEEVEVIEEDEEGVE